MRSLDNSSRRPLLWLGMRLPLQLGGFTALAEPPHRNFSRAQVGPGSIQAECPGLTRAVEPHVLLRLGASPRIPSKGLPVCGAPPDGAVTSTAEAAVPTSPQILGVATLTRRISGPAPRVQPTRPPCLRPSPRGIALARGRTSPTP